jgi:hypothetical protein
MQGVAAKGRISKEDAATICVEALDAIPRTTFIFEVISSNKPHGPSLMIIIHVHYVVIQDENRMICT